MESSQNFISLPLVIHVSSHCLDYQLFFSLLKYSWCMCIFTIYVFCISFVCTAEWFNLCVCVYTYTHIYSFREIFPLIDYNKMLSIVPCAYNRSLLAILYSSVHMLIPNTWIIPLSYPFDNHILVFYVCGSISVLYARSSDHFFLSYRCHIEEMIKMTCIKTSEATIYKKADICYQRN